MTPLTIPACGQTQGESGGLLEKIKNIIMLGEKFLEALRLVDAKSLSEKDLLDLDDLKDRINSHFDFFHESAFHSDGKVKYWFGNNDNK
jgi:hypothetical protein